MVEKQETTEERDGFSGPHPHPRLQQQAEAHYRGQTTTGKALPLGVRRHLWDTIWRILLSPPVSASPASRADKTPGDV